MRILLADHHTQPRLAVKQFLEVKPEFDLIGEAEDAQGVMALVKEHPVDLVMFDRELPGMDFEEMMACLKALPSAPIVIVMSSDFEYSRPVLKAGADAFVSKTERADWLLDILYKYARQVQVKEEAQKKEQTGQPAPLGAEGDLVF